MRHPLSSQRQRGFTLPEILIVCTLIALLVAFSIPVLSTALEQSREAVDIANIRSAVVEYIVPYVEEAENDEGLPRKKMDDGSITRVIDIIVDAHQKKGDWQGTPGIIAVGEGATCEVPAVTYPNRYEIVYGLDNGKMYIIEESDKSAHQL